MHIPDGYLGPATYGAMLGVMVPLWALASRKVKRDVQAKQIPYLAMGAAFSLIVMIFVLPLPGGTTGHMSGATLVAILLGPWSALMAVSISIIIQALILGDGGITAIGANCFNVAFIGAVIGYYLYRLLLGMLGLFRAGKAASGEPTPPSPWLQALAAGAASYAALNLGALATAIQLGIQPLIYGGTAHYFPYPVKYALPATMLPHLTVIGALEAIGTALVLGWLSPIGSPTRPISRCAPVLLAAAILLGASAATAHDYWIEKAADGYRVVYGHGGQILTYDPAQLKQVAVFDAAGKAVPFRRELKGREWVIKPRGPAAMVLVACDSGYWSKTIYGWKNLPKRKASRVVEAVHSYHYAKSILAWGEAVRRPLEGVRLDLVPQQNPFALKAGDILTLAVFHGGRPLAGAVVERDHEKVAVADRDGIARAPLKKGRQLLTVERKEPLQGDPDADFMVAMTTLTFEVTR